MGTANGIKNKDRDRPSSLTRCGIWRLHKPALIAWATSYCLLEQFDEAELKEFGKERLVEECLASLLRATVTEEYRAAADGDQARTIEELVYGPA